MIALTTVGALTVGFVVGIIIGAGVVLLIWHEEAKSVEDSKTEKGKMGGT